MKTEKKPRAGAFSPHVASDNLPCHVCTNTIFTNEDCWRIDTRLLHLGCRVHVLNSGHANRRNSRRQSRKGGPRGRRKSK